MSLKFLICTLLIVNYCGSFVLCHPTKRHSSKLGSSVLDNINNCGYQSCHPIKEGFINVHVVPHTHDDVGWLKTPDQYFYGSRNDIQTAGVQYILDTVVDSLRKDRNRRFIYVETAFFWKWWIKQHDIVKAHVRKLVRNGQLEFISGGWSMNDEAATNYQSIIDQMTWGLRKLNDTFGECGRPKVGWQIDPFGHSREMACIFAQLGFDGVLLGRIDYQDKSARFNSKDAEIVWRASQNLGESSEIFTGVMYNTYGPPPGFCFDILCNDEPIIDDKKSFDYNVNRRLDDFVAYLDNVTKVYDTSNVIITMGEDFNYQSADSWFENLDKLIQYGNERQANGSKYNLIYSTPSCYIKAIYDETHDTKSWAVKEDDFFPYSSDPHAFWTGYFTSRPTIKRFEREGNNFLQVCKQLYALTDLGPEDRVDLNYLREAMGVMQHHDAITGTEKQHVANDYARLLQRGIDECQYITAVALSNLVLPNATQNKDVTRDGEEPLPKIPFTVCPLLNISKCDYSEDNNNFVVTVYNPLSRPINKYVRIPVINDLYTVKDSKGEIQRQIVPIPKSVQEIPGRHSKATFELVFLAEQLPPLGFRSYFIERTNQTNRFNEFQNEKPVSFFFDDSTRKLSKISTNDIELPIDQKFMVYRGFVGDNKVATNRSSGAYIFRPVGPAEDIPIEGTSDFYSGPLVHEVHQQINDWISQVVSVYLTEHYVELRWLVGPIPVDDNNGREIIHRISTQLSTNSTFYTDSNGREMLKRVRDYRPTWKVELQEPIAGNYYPVTSKIALKDEEQNIELAILTDRAQGGTSLRDGDMELMIHRRCLHDDAFGVGEALNESAFGQGLVVRGSHYLVLGTTNGTNNNTDLTTAAIEKDIAQRKLLDSWIFFSPTHGLSYEEYQEAYVTEFSGLKSALPNNVNILTLEPWKGFTFLLRLEHVFEKNEDAELSQPAVVKLQSLFTPFEITSIKETTLGANQWLEDNKRLQFRTKSTESTESNATREQLQDDAEADYIENLVKREVQIVDIDDFEIVLNPMQIRTFVIEFNKTQ